MNYKRLNRNDVLRWLDEADSWADGTVQTFSTRHHNIDLLVDDDNAPYRFELSFYSPKTRGQMTWRFRTISDALLHVFNDLSENPDGVRQYENIQQALDRNCDMSTVVTHITYLYRDMESTDRDNSEHEFSIYLFGEITAAQAEIIHNSLEQERYFVPEQVGLPCVKWKTLDFPQKTEIRKNAWCELTGLEVTAQHSYFEMSVDELVHRFEKLQVTRNARDNGERPYLVSIEEELSSNVVVWADDFIDAKNRIRALNDEGTCMPRSNDITRIDCTCVAFATDDNFPNLDCEMEAAT